MSVIALFLNWITDSLQSRWRMSYFEDASELLHMAGEKRSEGAEKIAEYRDDQVYIIMSMLSSDIYANMDMLVYYVGGDKELMRFVGHLNIVRKGKDYGVVTNYFSPGIWWDHICRMRRENE